MRMSSRAARAFWILICSLTISAASFGQDRPNVLLIIVDDLGAGDLACLGADDLQTPHLDKLFKTSLRLDTFYANCPVCSPTRASVLTGQSPDRVGVPGVIRTHAENSWGKFRPQTITLPLAMQQSGYQTAAVGKWHLGLEPEDHPQHHGFDLFRGFLGDMMDDYFNHRRHNINYMRDGTTEIDPEGHATDIFSGWAVDYIRSQKREAKDSTTKPWFMYLAYNAPHTPIQPPRDWLDTVRQRQPGIEDRRAKLVALIEHMDHGIGRVLQALTESDQVDNTIVVFTSDNGGQVNVGANNGPIRDGKGSMYEGGLRIPACIRVPGLANALHGQSADAPAFTADWMPTILELTDIECPNNLDGRSLVPLIRQPSDGWPEPREMYFVRREGGRAYGGLTCEALRWGDYKLVHNLPTSSFELFNLHKDPLESNDLSQSQPKVFRDMQLRLQKRVQSGGRVPWQ